MRVKKDDLGSHLVPMTPRDDARLCDFFWHMKEDEDAPRGRPTPKTPRDDAR